MTELSDRENSSPGKTMWERWNRCAMGLRPSPFICTRSFAWGLEIIKGDRLSLLNPFRWDKVIVNCPGKVNYDPTMPRLFKWDSATQVIASDCKTYVDDLRTIGASEQGARRATHLIETGLTYLGEQDSTRKRRPESQQPGAWSGSISLSIPNQGLYVKVSMEKWIRAQNIVRDLLSYFDESRKELPRLNTKSLERGVGFLVHLSMTYPVIIPFLRGLYLTMNSCRPQRDAHGWKMSKRAWASYQESCEAELGNG